MDNSSKIILDLCGGTGSWSKPYVDAGYDVRLITLPYYDVRTYHPPASVYGVLAAPPCTHFSLAGSQYWKQKDLDGRTDDALSIVFAILRIIEECKPSFYAIENPKGRLTRWLGKPDMIFNMSEFGAPYRKPTYLWGHFNTLICRMPDPEIVVPFDRAPLYDLPADYNLDIDHCKRAARRSIYPPFFAYSFFLSNQ